MKKQLTKVSVVCLAFVLVMQCCLFASSKLVFAEAITDSYIVITKDGDGIEKVKEQHDVNSENGEALSVNLSESEAAQLEADNDIVCVEKDFTIENEAEAGWDMVKPTVDDWNMKAINADNATTSSIVKVAMLDSGVDYTEDILVKERRNFIIDDPVTTPLFEDTCGHGTSVASIICGKGVESNVNGVNGNIELYSARVLDNNKQAPISRVVEAIYWAIEKQVNIINISFGTQTYSEALKTAIDAATDQGILVIASVGNYGNSSIDYPAAFDNVVGVGSVNAAGEISNFSSTNDAVDLLAPGEAVLAQANFGEELTVSGTSLSAPHVAGIAACLWSKDLTMPSTFIKALLKLSAKEMAGAGSGYGLVDYEHALQIYDGVATQFEDIVEDNTNSSAEQNPSAEEPSNNDDNSQAVIEQNPSGEEVTANISDAEPIAPQVASNDIDKEDIAILEETPESSEEAVPVPDTPAIEAETNTQIIEDINSREFEERVIQEIQVADNNSIIEDFSDPFVTGSWETTVHQTYGANASMKVGAIYADKHSPLKGIKANPEFHGFAWHSDSGGALGTGDCNFMSNYRYLIKVANAYGNGNGYTSVLRSEVEGLSTSCYNQLVEGFKAIRTHDLNGATNCTYCNKSVNIWNKGNDTLQKAFVMGLAMHVAMDAFAHSSFYKPTAGSGITWKRIVHEPNNIADDITFRSGRVQMAYAVARNVVSRYNGNRGSYHTCNDFYNTSSGAYTGLDYRITKMKTFAEAAGYTTTSVLSDFGKLQSQ